MTDESKKALQTYRAAVSHLDTLASAFNVSKAQREWAEETVRQALIALNRARVAAGVKVAP